MKSLLPNILKISIEESIVGFETIPPIITTVSNELGKKILDKLKAVHPRI